MFFKVNLHFHSAEDPADRIGYTLKEGIAYAARAGFRALAVTCHNACAWNEEAAAYALARGMLLIPGIELSLHEEWRGGNPLRGGRHVLLLGAEKSAENIRTFRDLEEYRRLHPQTFTIAAHPFMYRAIGYGQISLNGLLAKYIHLIDAIEHTWFYSKWFNRNVLAVRAAATLDRPLIATSDTHFFDFMDDNYALIDASTFSQTAIFDAIRARRFENVTSPRRLWRDMVGVQGRYLLRMWFRLR